MNNIELQQNWEDDGLHEECGVFGMYDLDGNDIASSIYYGLLHCNTEDRKAVVLLYQTRLDLEKWIC